MSEIHLIIGSVPYGGSRVEMAFECREDADSICRKMEEHNTKYPNSGDYPDEEWEKWEKDETKWKKRSPYKHQSEFRDYHVESHRIIPKGGKP